MPLLSHDSGTVMPKNAEMLNSAIALKQSVTPCLATSSACENNSPKTPAGVVGRRWRSVRDDSIITVFQC